MPPARLLRCHRLIVRIAPALAVLLLAPAGCGGDDGPPPDAGRDGVAEGPPRDGGPTDTALDSAPDAPPDLGPRTSWIDPFIATGGQGFGVGSALPGATRPFGLVKVSPDTVSAIAAPGFYHCAGYYYEDTLMDGLSHVHMHGTGVPDYGLVLFMPTLGMDATKTTEAGYRAGFSHDGEAARPGYYAVTLESGIRIEVTATERAAHHRYTYPDRADAVVIVDLGHTIGEGRAEAGEMESLAPGALRGWMHNRGDLSARFGGFRVYMDARFRPAPIETGFFADGALGPGPARGRRVGAYLRFGAPVVEAQVGLSYVDLAGAAGNRERELPAWNFEATRQEADAAWLRELRPLEVEGGSPAERRIFETALYHVFQMPTLFSDVDRRYRGLDGEVHRADRFLYYTDFSQWDTFRTLHPLLTLIAPARQRDMLVSLVKMVEQGGEMPRWPMATGETGCMVGASADIVFADSRVKGVIPAGEAVAWEAMRRAAMGPLPPGARYGSRPGIEDWIAFGYLPADRHGGSVSTSLEYAYDDFALAALGRALGRDADAATLAARAGNYAHLWDPETRFFRGRNADGTFAGRFDPTDWMRDYVEGNAWQLLWYVPHDVPGLARLHGGEAALVERLDEFFRLSAAQRDTAMPDPYYWHGNEPDIHAAYLYVEAGRPDRAAEWVRWILATKYKAAPDGLDGNDDGGTLSAWYVWSAIGLYPVSATDRYLIGSPIFRRAVLHLAGGDFVIEAPEASAENRFVQSAELGGAPLAEPVVRHADLARGGRLRLVLGPSPSGWGRR